LQVHDEWVAEVRFDLWEEVADIMPKVMVATAREHLGDGVPFASDVEVGYNWRDLMEPDKFRQLLQKEGVTS
jgi:DNA polymerase I-like protein with 3'-5' exonuclease and polymerase domains